MARPKGISELEKGVVIHEVWQRISNYLIAHPKTDLKILMRICMPIAVKSMPQEIQGEGLAQIFQLIVHGVSESKNRLSDSPEANNPLTVEAPKAELSEQDNLTQP